MEDVRKFQRKPRAARKILDYHSCDDVEDMPKRNSNFKFPPPPKVQWQSSSDIDSTSDSLSDTAREASPESRHNSVFTMRGYQSDGSPAPKCLPPIGVFWDIENCQIPRGRSAVTVAQTIRDRFFDGYREVEFLVVCDVKKETAQVVQELNDAQVNLIHVGATSKNAADEKLRQSIRRFADIHGSPSAVILISGDINFAPDLCDIRHRKKVHVILIHTDMCSESLILCANEHYSFSSLVSNLPYRINTRAWNQPSEVFVTNLPSGQDNERLRQRLKRLAENCGGKVGFISDLSTTIRFPSLEAAARAQKRMDGEKVFGSVISVGHPIKVSDVKLASPIKNNQSRRMPMSIHNTVHQTSVQFSSPKTELKSPLNSAYNFYKLGTMPLPQTLFVSGLARSKSMVNTHLMPMFYDTRFQQTSRIISVSNMVPQTGRPILGVQEPDSRIMRPVIPGTMAVSLPDNKSDHLLYQKFLNVVTPRKCRTPSPYTTLGINTSIPPPPIVNLPRKVEKENKENKVNPVFKEPPLPAFKAVELHMTNVDNSLDPLELKNILMSTFNNYVMVLHVSVSVQANGNLAATVNVPSIQAAQVALSHLQRLNVGLKHFMICYPKAEPPKDIHTFRGQIVSILLQVPGFQLPLIKFCELFEIRYGCAVHIPSLYSLQDMCVVTDDIKPNGPVIYLLLKTTSPACSQEKKVCEGCIKPIKEPTCDYQHVKLSLSVFAKNLCDLLSTHNNTLPLNRLVQCYETAYGKIEVVQKGVPLEYMVIWVSDIELYLDTQSVKHIRRVNCDGKNKQKTDDNTKDTNSTASVSSEVLTFSHEVIELLRLQPCGRILLSQLVPAYHQHFGRQCRMADYGFSKLNDLLDVISKSVQILGEGNNRILMPTKRVQMRHFTSNLIQVLRSQSSKRVGLSEFYVLYERIFERKFDPVDYGLSYLYDLLAQITDNTVSVEGTGNAQEIVMVRREQTTEEVERTKQFATEIFELLSTVPEYVLSLDKFVPTYHFHYKRQCRVADYGFTKLVQLLDAIPHVVKLEENDKERNVSLTLEKKMKALCTQILELVVARLPSNLPINNVGSAFLLRFGFELVPAAYGCIDVYDLLAKLPTIKVSNIDGTVSLTLPDQLSVQRLSLQARRVLWESPKGKMMFIDFQKSYQDLFKESCALEALEKDLGDTVKVIRDKLDEVSVQLTILQLFARDVYRLLCLCKGRLALGSFEAVYLRTFGTVVQPSQYGYPNVTALLLAIPHTVQLKTKGGKHLLMLSKEILAAGIVLPSSLNKNSPSHRANYDNNADMVTSIPQVPHIVAPDPSELPLPLPQLFTCKEESQPLMDKVGVLEMELLKQSCSSVECVQSPNFMANNKRKMRLAAQFQTPIQLI